MGGTITVKVTMDGGKIAKVEVVSHKESEGIADPALSNVPEAIVAANSADVDTITGATQSNRFFEQVRISARQNAKNPASLMMRGFGNRTKFV